MKLRIISCHQTQRLSGITLATMLVLFSTGCDTTEHTANKPSTTYKDAGHVISSSDRPASPPVTSLATTDSNTLTPGTFDIRLNEGKVTLLANNAPVRDILNSLAIMAGFELLDAGTPPEQVTLSIDGRDVHSMLVELLKPGPYRIIYTFDSTHGVDALTQVVTGHPATMASMVPAQSPLPGVDRTGINLQGAPLPDASQAELPAEDQAYLSLLLDPSEEVRADAAESISATGIALDYLARILTTDPSPEVRMAATYSLENSEDPRAVDTLILGLNDSDPAVLVEVINSLEFHDKRRVVPYLQPLQDHPDEDVRDAVESALESLQ